MLGVMACVQAVPAGPVSCNVIGLALPALTSETSIVIPTSVTAQGPVGAMRRTFFFFLFFWPFLGSVDWSPLSAGVDSSVSLGSSSAAAEGPPRARRSHVSASSPAGVRARGGRRLRCWIGVACVAGDLLHAPPQDADRDEQHDHREQPPDPIDPRWQRTRRTHHAAHAKTLTRRSWHHRLRHAQLLTAPAGSGLVRHSCEGSALAASRRRRLGGAGQRSHAAADSGRSCPARLRRVDAAAGRHPALLADDAPGEAVRMWGRLGYPRRALRLHQAAITIEAEYDGIVPSDYRRAQSAARHRRLHRGSRCCLRLPATPRRARHQRASRAVARRFTGSSSPPST